MKETIQVKMTVNFNNLRKQAVFSYDRLVKKLNQNIIDDYGDKVVRIDPEDIQEDLDDLRRLIMSIALVYDEGNPDFKDLDAEIPDDIACFNSEEE